MKPTRLFFTAIRVPVDYLLLLIAALLTYFIRFESFRTILPATSIIPPAEYIRITLVVAGGWVLLFAANGLYTTRRMRFTEEIGKVIFGCATGFVAVLLYLVFTQELFTSRFLILGTFLLAIIVVTIGRLLLRAIERITLTSGLGTIRLVAIGAESERAVFRSEFSKNSGLGYRLISEYETLNDEAVEQIKVFHKKEEIDGIFIADAALVPSIGLDAANLAEDLHLRFFYSADLFAAASVNRTTHTLAGTPVIETRRARLDGWGRILKRVFDIIISGILLILLSPALAIIAICIAIETGRPILFKNERVGERARTFDTLKFRSMYQKDSIGKQFPNHEHALKYEAELIEKQSIKTGPLYKIKNDPRVTPIGRFIRRWSLDELPQLWNVFRGDMSLVGPRPHQPREVEKYARHHRHVLAVKPGITGLAQISGRSDLDFEDEVRLDTYYIENWSPVLDLIIILKTPLVVLKRHGVY
ncbi:MAG: sugar transferase [bacterium]|nr:sugar transferase [bacterium]